MRDGKGRGGGVEMMAEMEGMAEVDMEEMQEIMVVEMEIEEMMMGEMVD